MNARVKTRTWFRIHSFIGVITGLLLFVICWSGTFAVVSNEIDWLVTPELRVEPQDKRVSWGELKATAEAAYPEATVSGIDAPLYRRSVATVRMNLADGGGKWLLIDPYTAEVTAATDSFTVQRFFRDFHRRLFYPNPWGTYVVSLFAITMLASLVAALCFYKRWWKRFFGSKGGRGRVFWSELHKTAGLWSIWFLLIIGLTGLWYLIEELRYHVGDGIIAYTGDPSSAVRVLPQPASDRALPTLPLDSLVERVQQRRPELDIRFIRRGQAGGLYVDGQAGDFLVRNRANQIYLDARTGDVLYDQRASDLPLYWRWSDTADPLHFGDFGGLTSKLVWFVFGLVLNGLILTGTYLHAQRLAREAGNRQRARWPGTLAACAVSIVVLGGAVPFGFQSSRDYGPVVDGTKQFPTLAPGVQAFIIGWIAVTLGIIAVWVWMLWRPRRQQQSTETQRSLVP